MGKHSFIFISLFLPRAGISKFLSPANRRPTWKRAASRATTARSPSLGSLAGGAAAVPCGAGASGGGGGSARPGPYDRPSAASGFGRGGMMMGGGGGGGGYPGGMGNGGRVNYTFNSLLIANLSKMLSFFILLE